MTRSPARQDQRPGSFPFLLTHRRRVRGVREWLALDVSLTMLWIPPGRFWMGSPPDELERGAAEGPQHRVQLQGFFLGQTPVTQAQWQAVAQWTPQRGEPPYKRSLEANPSRFSGPQRPVENVSWHDAMEFCRRLRQRLGQPYTLPSEAQWEYACRAGTTTPFHFGATLRSDLANYNGNNVYGVGTKGVYREQTTDVGSFPANAWGLHDMHGNVWEWCADDWHGDYQGAPEDGRAWLKEGIKSADGDDQEQGSDWKLLRGGSWIDRPGLCRSACRLNGLPDGRGDDVGFRVCCLPQDVILYP